MLFFSKIRNSSQIMRTSNKPKIKGYSIKYMMSTPQNFQDHEKQEKD